ncbi:hypothetical protein WN51_09344 [Melipona quadrifasciata]|uniref:Uncharacterized protein n=1 Tax=Melipona quadrifasciata TaxID=166423 RepID=A0A0M9A7X1_9HYME|nr:hypothetical protein WN51_09344 [Melipona quadrifasciata]
MLFAMPTHCLPRIKFDTVFSLKSERIIVKHGDQTRYDQKRSIKARNIEASLIELSPSYAQQPMKVSADEDQNSKDAAETRRGIKGRARRFGEGRRMPLALKRLNIEGVFPLNQGGLCDRVPRKGGELYSKTVVRIHAACEHQQHFQRWLAESDARTRAPGSLVISRTAIKETQRHYFYGGSVVPCSGRASVGADDAHGGRKERKKGRGAETGITRDIFLTLQHSHLGRESAPGRFVNSRYGSVEREEPGGNNARTNKDTAHFSSMFPWPIIRRIDEHVAIKIFSTLLGSPPLAIRTDEAKAWRSIRCRKYWDCDLRALVHVAPGPNGDEFNARPITALPGVKSRAPEVQQDYRNGPLRFGNGFRPPLPFKTLERLGARISRSELSRSELSGMIIGLKFSQSIRVLAQRTESLIKILDISKRLIPFRFFRGSQYRSWLRDKLRAVVGLGVSEDGGCGSGVGGDGAVVGDGFIVTSWFYALHAKIMAPSSWNHERNRARASQILFCKGRPESWFHKPTSCLGFMDSFQTEARETSEQPQAVTSKAFWKSCKCAKEWVKNLRRASSSSSSSSSSVVVVVVVVVDVPRRAGVVAAGFLLPATLACVPWPTPPPPLPPPPSPPPPPPSPTTTSGRKLYSTIKYTSFHLDILNLQKRTLFHIQQKLQIGHFDHFGRSSVNSTKPISTNTRQIDESTNFTNSPNKFQKVVPTSSRAFVLRTLYNFISFEDDYAPSGGWETEDTFFKHITFFLPKTTYKCNLIAMDSVKSRLIHVVDAKGGPTRY